MRNEGSGACKVSEAVKRWFMEVLDEFAGKRFDTGGSLFWNRNARAEYEEVRRIVEAHAQ
jgi:hypothetical protein